MLRNYFLIAWRKLTKNKAFSLINIAGLALGVFACLSIYLHVVHELSYDRFHARHRDIYRVNMATKWGNNEDKRGSTPPPVARVMMHDIPEVEVATRLYATPDEMVFIGNQAFRETSIVATDTNFFSIFSFRLRQGNARTSLQNPQSVILTEATARKYFGPLAARHPQAILGRLVSIGKDRRPFTVTGIVENVPSNSHIQFDLLTSVNSYENVKFFDWSWVWTQVATYVRLKPGTDPGRLEPKLAQLVETYAPAAFERMGFPYKQFKAGNNYWRLYLQPLEKIWLYSGEAGNRVGGSGSSFFVYAFASIGVFVLLLACINFINLSTAGATERAREVGLRKTMGTSRRQLMGQFLAESLLICVFAVIAGFTLHQVAAGYLGQIGLRVLPLQLMGSGHLLLLVAGLVLILSTLAGAYPAFYLSGFEPIRALKGHFKSGKPAQLLRNVLVTFQFSISVALILVTLVINKQIRYLQAKDLGFDRAQLLIIENADQLGSRKASFKTDILNLPGVSSVSQSAYQFPRFFNFEDTYRPLGSPVRELTLTSLVADEDFISTMGLQLRAGRNFSRNNAGDSRSVILNEMAVRQLGWKDPIGQTLEYPGLPSSDNRFKVIGVINDFHAQPTNVAQTPMALFLPQSGHPTAEGSYLLIRLQGNVSRQLASLKKQWNQNAQGWPFEYRFVDEDFTAAYRNCQDTQWLILLFSGISIVISGMGLLGLAVFATTRRTREIGVRKVLGASVHQIVLMLNREFTLLLVLAFVLGAPAGFLMVQQWLDDFAYRTVVSWMEVVLPGLLTFLLAVATVSYISLKAARANPVKALRTE